MDFSLDCDLFSFAIYTRHFMFLINNQNCSNTFSFSFYSHRIEEDIK